MKMATVIYLDTWNVSCSILIINFSVSSDVSSSCSLRAVSSFCLTVTWRKYVVRGTSSIIWLLCEREGRGEEKEMGITPMYMTYTWLDANSQLAQPHLVSSLEVEYVVPLALQEGLEGEDELEVGDGGHVVSPLHLKLTLIQHTA